MWYLSISDRLKRWHAEHESQEEVMCHPSDAAEWKRFDTIHPNFAKEKRIVRFGLCTDGFNPFGMQKKHSLWSVIVTPYNLPSEMCMNSEYLFLTVLNFGPKHPRRSLDVFHQPLIEDLKELWNNGVEEYDVSLNKNFNLRAVLLWTISDYPAYGMLSGWTIHGKLSCPICMEDTQSFYLTAGRKVCWFDCHQRFLPMDHPLRRNTVNFRTGKNVVNDYPPESLTGAQVYRSIKRSRARKTFEVGENGHEKRLKCYGVSHHCIKGSLLDRSQSTTLP